MGKDPGGDVVGWLEGWNLVKLVTLIYFLHILMYKCCKLVFI